MTNAGPSKVTGVVIHDSISSAFTGVIYTATQSGGAFGFNASGSGNLFAAVNRYGPPTHQFQGRILKFPPLGHHSVFGNVALSIVEGLITDSGGNVFAVADSASSTITPSR